MHGDTDVVRDGYGQAPSLRENTEREYYDDEDCGHGVVTVEGLLLAAARETGVAVLII